MKTDVPKEVVSVIGVLDEAGFEAYLVGGCVRDLILKREPKDWDIAASARPEEIQKLFKDSVYENDFGTVGIKTESEDPKLKIIEVTTYRIEGKYTDKRHPDEVKFAKTIEEDLSRRDFTVNAMAMKLENDTEEQSPVASRQSLIIDPFGGREDIKNHIIRTVGNPEDRFSEDALRLLRAVRFATELDFSAKVGISSGH